MPAATLQMIVEYCDITCLRNVRLTCKALMVWVNPILRRNLIVDISPTKSAYSRLSYLVDYHHAFNINRTVK